MSGKQNPAQGTGGPPPEPRTLADMVRDYALLLEDKALLEKQTKDNNAAIEAAKKEIADQMLDDDCASIAIGGYSYSLTAKTKYSKKSEEALAEAGADFFAVLRQHGLGDLIKETVNAQTLNSTLREYAEQHDGELGDDLAAVINTFDYNDITRTKLTKKKPGKKGKKEA